jgi:hypothetical protein
MRIEVGARDGSWQGGMRGCGDEGAGFSAVFGSFGHAESRHPSAYPYYIYIGIYTYYLLSIYKIDDRKCRKPVLPRWKGSRFPLGSPADILPMALAENAAKSSPAATKGVAMAVAWCSVRTPSQLFSETPK